jgi:hypothetical protein
VGVLLSICYDELADLLPVALFLAIKVVTALVNVKRGKTVIIYFSHWVRS